MTSYGLDRRYIFRRDGSGYAHRRRQRQQRVQREIYRAEELEEVSLAKIGDPENLLLVYEKRKQEGGAAPGIDGLTDDDFSRTEIAGVFRHVSTAIRQGNYVRQRPRLVHIAKGDGRNRELRLGTIVDRTVDKALQEAITPELDKIFMPEVMGFRPGRGIWDVLLGIERTAIEQNRWVIAQADIRDAFPSIRIDDVLADYRRHITDPGVLWLIETVLRGHEGQARTVGIDQGSAVSPITLNLRLHYALDLPLSAAGPGIPPRYRYADNLIYQCRSVSEGHQTLQRVRQLLEPAGFALKGEEGPPVDLRRQGAGTEVLGFRISAEEGRLVYRLGKGAWQSLAQSLEHAYEGPEPVKAAIEAVRGWIAAYGPAFESVEESVVLRRVRQVASRIGYRELGMEADLVGCLCQARDRWVRVRERALQVPDRRPESDRQQ